jgi:hypothetical protein
VIKLTYQVIDDLKLKLHPIKTYIGKISHGFNFLAYYMDPQKILPSQETIRRFHERAAALYELPQGNLPRRYKKQVHDRDISVYPVHEAPPTNQQLQQSLTTLLERGSKKPDILMRLRRYIGQWTCWLKLGLSMCVEFVTSVQTFLPCLFSLGARVGGGSAVRHAPLKRPYFSSQMKHEILHDCPIANTETYIHDVGGPPARVGCLACYI